jgi:hypothetical protein
MYFKDLINVNTKKYLPAFNSYNGIPYDMAKTKLYSKEVKIGNIEKKENCSTDKEFSDSTKDKYWGNHVFPDKTAKLTFLNTVSCSFGPLIYIMQQISGKIYSIRELKTMLWDAYQEYMIDKDKKEKIIKILKKQGKKRELLNGFDVFFNSENYFITTLDIWVFAQKYEIPVILFCSKNNMQDVYITQDKTYKLQNQDYLFDEVGRSVKNGTMANSWIILGYNKRQLSNDKFFFLESASQIREAHKITNNVLIQQQFHKTQLKDFEKRLTNIFNEHVLSFSEYLDALEI